VVAPAAGGPLDLVDDGRTGFLVPPCDAGAVAHAVATLIGDPERRLAMGVAARVAVERRSWPSVCDELIQHYLEVQSGGLPLPAVRVPA
jgi:phosphatidylinositol alpha 1,6-mannosyltransferase